MENEIKAYLETIANAYVSRNRVSNPTEQQIAYIEQCNVQYRNDIHTMQGKKFIRVVHVPGGQRSVHSFICMEDTPKFKKGDILKAAGWVGPALNFARGNIFEPASYAGVQWMGA